MSNPALGIMTLHVSGKINLEERSYFRKLIVAGKKRGLHTFVFTPLDVDTQRNSIYAYHYDTRGKRWVRKWTPFPHVVYDRCRFKANIPFHHVRQFRSTYAHLLYLNHPIGDKWKVQQALELEPELASYLPKTIRYEHHDDLLQFIRKQETVYLKPINGTGGRGIIRLERQPGGKWLIQGRNRSRHIIPPKLVQARHLPAYLSAWNIKGTYLIQQAIRSRLPDGRVHDLRLLIQKTGSGTWDVTGCAGRIGPKESVTSNLHGGGEAIPMRSLLAHWVRTDDKMNAVHLAVHDLGYKVAHAMERKYGPLCELGLDIAVDEDGHPWLLEINPKPAREVFNRIGEQATYEQTIARPLDYARWLYEQNVSPKRPKRRIPKKL